MFFVSSSQDGGQGVLANGVSAESSGTPKEKAPKNIGPSITSGTQSATAESGIVFGRQQTLLRPKNPRGFRFLVPDLLAIPEVVCSVALASSLPRKA